MITSLLPLNSDHVMVHLIGYKCAFCSTQLTAWKYVHVYKTIVLVPKWFIAWSELGGNREVNTDREDEVSEMFRLSLLFFWRIRWSISSHAKMTDVGKKKMEPVRNCCYSSQLLARFMRALYILRNGDVLHVYLPWALRKHSDAHCTSAGILVDRTVENAPVQWPIAARVVTKK